MNLSITFKKPTVKGAYDWQLSQEINVSNEAGDVIAKAEIELITLNKHRDADKSFAMLDEQEATDWELPLGVYFKKQNLIAEYCEKLLVKPDTNAKTHIMIEAISVQPAYRKQGVAKYLLNEIALHYPKVQSLNVMSMAMNLFVDLEFCNGEENTQYYTKLALENEAIANEELKAFFTASGFMQVEIDESLLAEPLPFELFIASPATIKAIA
ncbi:GNAT family N-acetyltransferase [Pseudocolwellia agarivorans]|uniref:GNAT family N-acetyltransferase n=1 Tax=Pseudocolwellia agarivorans TaxID=1911682 RepID=UPI0009866639|nr:GNAT family N-acetyltransferase [Pseudocolwellia agarivorans]